MGFVPPSLVSKKYISVILLLHWGWEPAYSLGCAVYNVVESLVWNVTYRVHMAQENIQHSEAAFKKQNRISFCKTAKGKIFPHCFLFSRTCSNKVLATILLYSLCWTLRVFVSVLSESMSYGFESTFSVTCTVESPRHLIFLFRAGCHVSRKSFEQWSMTE